MDVGSEPCIDTCVLLPWDSEFWNRRIGKAEGRALTLEKHAAMDEWARQNEIDCLYLLTSSEESSTVILAQDVGFRLMDVRVELVRPTGGVEEHTATIRPSTDTDLEALRAIARVSHRATRFYADPNFPLERCDDLYDTWIARSCRGWADEVLVAEKEDRTAGYVTCHINDKTARGSIGLIAVSSEARNLGIGRALILDAVSWCEESGLEKVSIVTQGRNVAALRLFQRCGFLIDSVTFWFHKWYSA